MLSAAIRPRSASLRNFGLTGPREPRSCSRSHPSSRPKRRPFCRPIPPHVDSRTRTASFKAAGGGSAWHLLDSHRPSLSSKLACPFDSAVCDTCVNRSTDETFHEAKARPPHRSRRGQGRDESGDTAFLRTPSYRCRTPRAGAARTSPSQA